MGAGHPFSQRSIVSVMVVDARTVRVLRGWRSEFDSERVTVEQLMSLGDRTRNGCGVTR